MEDPVTHIATVDTTHTLTPEETLLPDPGGKRSPNSSSRVNIPVILSLALVGCCVCFFVNYVGIVGIFGYLFLYTHYLSFE